MGNQFLRTVITHVLYAEGAPRTSALIDAVVARGNKREDVIRELIEMGIDGVLAVKPPAGMEEDWRECRRVALAERCRQAARSV